MKSIIYSFLILILTGSVAWGSSQEISFADEPYVDDIPFSTSVIASTTWNHDLFVDMWKLDVERNVNDNNFNAGIAIPVENLLEFEDEDYINDIPFNTEALALEYKTNEMLTTLGEEEYADDIPFDTEEIALNSITRNMMGTYSEEAYIDDIPFSTSDLYNQHMMENVFDEYRAEQVDDDIPFNTAKLVSDAQVDELLTTLNNEPTADDIPFNTEMVSFNTFMEMNFASYFDEESVRDIPFCTGEIFCEYRSCKDTEKEAIRGSFSILGNKNKGKIIFSLTTSDDHIRHMEGLMDCMEESLEDVIFMNEVKDLKFKYSPLTTDL